MGGESTAKPAKPGPAKSQTQLEPVIDDIGDVINLFESSSFKKAFSNPPNTAEDLPEAFKGLLEPLKLTKSAFTKYSKDATGNVAESEKSSSTAAKRKQTITAIDEQIKKLYTICKTAIRADGKDTPPLKRYISAVKAPNDRVEVLVGAILEGALKDIAKEPFLTAAEVQKLQEELGKVKKLPASLPEPSTPAGQNIYQNYGSGAINVAHGSGDINSNTGSGPQIKGETLGDLYFGVPGVTAPAARSGG